QPPPLGLDRAEHDVHGELAPVPAPAEQLQARPHRAGAWLVEVFGTVADMPLGEAVWDQDLHPLADQLLPWVAEHLLGLGVGPAASRRAGPPRRWRRGPTQTAGRTSLVFPSPAPRSPCSFPSPPPPELPAAPRRRRPG